MESSKDSILFICKNNSSRSPMAELISNSLYWDKYNGFVLDQNQQNWINIHINKNYFKSLDIFKNKEFKYVITVCEDGTCPYFNEKIEHIHKSFKNLSKIKGDEKKIFNAFRTSRDEIKKWIIDIIENGVI